MVSVFFTILEVTKKYMAMIKENNDKVIRTYVRILLNFIMERMIYYISTFQ